MAVYQKINFFFNGKNIEDLKILVDNYEKNDENWMRESKTKILLITKEDYDFNVNKGIVTSPNFPFKNIKTIRLEENSIICVEIIAKLVPIKNSYDFEIIELTEEIK